jgi:DHA1 family multidrug resistance protein-like MFS transporter
MRLTKPSFDLPRPAILLSGGIFVLSICSFMIVPLLALYLATELRVPAGQVGVVLAVMAVANQGLQLFVGVVSDRLGSRAVFNLGILAASLGYVGFALAPPFALQLVCAFTLGLGRATISLVGKVLLTQEAGGHRASALTLRSIAVNAGASIGPIVGGLLFGRFGAVLVGVVVVHAVFWLVLIRTIPRHAPAPEARPRLRAQFAALLGNRALLALAIVSVGFWYLYTQVTFTFPLYADDRFALGGKVGLLFAVNAVIAVVLQYGAIAWFGRHTDEWRTLAVGSVLVGVAFLVLVVVPSAWSLVAFIAVFSLGEIVVVPTLDILTANLAAESAIGGSFGLASLGWAVGGVLGSLLGGVGYEAAARSGDTAWFWLASGLVGVVSAVAFLVLRRRFPARAAEPATAGEAG